MNLSNLKLHRNFLVILIITWVTTFILTLSYGDYKSANNIDWFNVAGEGSITIITQLWIIFVLLSRPKGRVTTLLFTGFLIMNLSVTLDFIDEFVRYNEEHSWFDKIESIPTPFGMVLMTLALYYWHQEQMNINLQLKSRERFYREHQLHDVISGLANADYMKRQISNELSLLVNNDQYVFSLIMLDIAQFNQFNRQFGDNEGDKLLNKFAHLICDNLRDQDLVCRYASDCFIIMLPNTELEEAEKINELLIDTLEGFSFKVCKNGRLISKQKVHTSIITTSKSEASSSDKLLRELHCRLLNSKRAFGQVK